MVLMERPTQASTARPKRKFPYRKVHELEEEIEQVEQQIEQLEASLADPEVHKDGLRLADITAAYDATRQQLAALYEHWEEASELN